MWKGMMWSTFDQFCWSLSGKNVSQCYSNPIDTNLGGNDRQGSPQVQMCVPTQYTRISAWCVKKRITFFNSDRNNTITVHTVYSTLGLQNFGKKAVRSGKGICFLSVCRPTFLMHVWCIHQHTTSTTNPSTSMNMMCSAWDLCTRCYVESRL